MLSRSWGLLLPDLAPVLAGERGEGEKVAGSVDEHVGGGGEPVGDLVDHAGVLGMHLFGVGVLEDGALLRGDQALLSPGHAG